MFLFPSISRAALSAFSPKCPRTHTTRVLVCSPTHARTREHEAQNGQGKRHYQTCNKSTHLLLDEKCAHNPRHLWGVFAFASCFFAVKSAKDPTSPEITRFVKLGNIEDFKPGEMYEIQVNDGKDKVLLTYVNGEFFCTSSSCPHYGAPLVKGIATKDHVKCPWHDAEFDLKTGKCINGPTTSSILTFPVEVRNGEVQVLLPGALDEAKTPKFAKLDSSVDNRVFAIVGGGPSGFSAVETLRSEGFQGRIVLYSGESIPPYDRVVLTKNFRCRSEDIALRPLAFYSEELNVELHLNELVTSVDLTGQTLKTSKGETLTYDKVLIATGSSARRLDFIPGNDADGIVYLRTMDDLEKFRNSIFRGPNDFRNLKFVIIGSSFIGMETASALHKLGVKKVTVVGKEPVPFQSVLGDRVGSSFLSLMKKNGVDYVPNTGAIEFTHQGPGVDSVRLENGDVLQADRVLVGAGACVNLPKFEHTPSMEGGGLKVDPFMRIVGKSNAFAAGDIATFPYIKTGDDVRVEHYAVAMQQGRIAALNMLDAQRPYIEIPFFWTAVFGKGLRYAGVGRGYDDVIVEGDLENFQFVAYYCQGNKVVAVCTMGRDPVAVACVEALQKNLMPSVDELRSGLKNSQDILTAVKKSAMRQL